MKTNLQYHNSQQKRIFDIIVALVLILLLIPIFVIGYPILILLIGSPIIFRQKRVGRNKQPFLVYKIRTMHKNAEKQQKKLASQNEAPYPMFKIDHDPRFNKIGRALSKLGLDELPQLINILKGEMSFVGPRPLPLHEAEQLDPTWDFRYEVRPGLLSIWALSPKRHQSLTAWKKLEKETLKIDNVQQELQLFLRAIYALFLSPLFPSSPAKKVTNYESNTR